MGNQALWAAMQEKNELLAKPKLTDAEGTRLGELEGVIAEEDGYSAEADAGELLSGLGIPEHHHEQVMSELPGGLKLRVLLAQALFGNPEALLLDEPTNNLDIDSIRWLENFLSEYKGVLITISHDRRFLNRICTHIADIDYETIIVYPGGYDDMVRAKGQVRNKIESENAERSKKIAQLQDFVARFSRRHARLAGAEPKEADRAAFARPISSARTSSGRSSASSRRSRRASRRSPSTTSARSGRNASCARNSAPSSRAASGSPSSAAPASARPRSARC